VGKKRKTWIVVKGPRERRIQTILGYYPDLSLADARQSAYAALSRPHDPKPVPTFTDALAAFLAQDKRWKPNTLYKMKSSLKHFTWTKALDKITHADVGQALDKIEGQSARAHALKDLRTFFNWTVPRYIPNSPASGFRMPAYKPRERVLSDDELKRVWLASETMGTFGAIIMLLILTGQRRGEIASLKWQWIKEDRITLPNEITKNGREHSFPLGSLASKVLPTRTPPTHDYMFPATSTKSSKDVVPYNGWGKHHKQLLKASATSDWTIHDLRRTFASNLGKLGVPIHVTEKLLNHVSGTTGGIVGVYQKHQYWDEQVAAIQSWEDRLLSIVRG